MIRCMDCRCRYSDLMACDLVIPRAQWLAINPQDGGVLCANCLLRRAAALPGTVNITGRITTGDDSLEAYQQASMGGSELKPPAPGGDVDAREDIQAGELCFAGTRIPVECVLSFARAGYSIAQIGKEYPTLTALQIEAASALASQASPSSGWRPIETAPRDGTVFLGCNLDHPTFGSWPMYRRVRHTFGDDGSCATKDLGGWAILHDVEPDYSEGNAVGPEPDLSLAADHLNKSVRYGWMPLPTPPSSIGGEG